MTIKLASLLAHKSADPIIPWVVRAKATSGVTGVSELPFGFIAITRTSEGSSGLLES